MIPYKVNDLVRCKKNVNDDHHNLIGVIVEVFDHPNAAVEIEFSDVNGKTINTATLSINDIEVINHDGPIT